ncbi:hypothetical protein AX16_008628 [Volvariella volvacea WC 439]|nr:hypothetical protein AX16_008628 [Volvariella volvacea WC 439]
MSSFKSRFRSWFQATKRSIFKHHTTNTDTHPHSTYKGDGNRVDPTEYSSENMSGTSNNSENAMNGRGDTPERLHNAPSKNPLIMDTVDSKEAIKRRAREQSQPLVEVDPTPGPEAQGATREDGGHEENQLTQQVRISTAHEMQELQSDYGDSLKGDSVDEEMRELMNQLTALANELRDVEGDAKQVTNADILDLEKEIAGVENNLAQLLTEQEVMTMQIQTRGWDTKVFENFFMSKCRLDVNKVKFVIHRLNGSTTQASRKISNALFSVSPTTLTRIKANPNATFKDGEVLPPGLLAYLRSSHEHQEYRDWMAIALNAVLTWCISVHIQAWSVTDKDTNECLSSTFESFRESDATSAFVWKRVTFPTFRDAHESSDNEQLVENLWEEIKNFLALCGWGLDLILEDLPSLETELDAIFYAIVGSTMDIRDALMGGVSEQVWFGVQWVKPGTPFDVLCMRPDAASPSDQGSVLCTTGIGLVTDFSLLSPHATAPVIIKDLEAPVVLTDVDYFSSFDGAV